MQAGLRMADNGPSRMLMIAVLLVIPFLGCSVTPIETHKKGMESLTEKDYFISKRPVDRHYIGCAWSKQFGPIDDPGAADIRIKVERSFDTLQQNFAYNVGISLGGQSTLATVKTQVEKVVKSEKGAKQEKGATDEKITSDETSPKQEGKAKEEKSTKDGKGIKKPEGINGAVPQMGIEAGAGRRSEFEHVQIISPVSLADIPFEMNIPYITEALRLGNFRLKSESAARAGITSNIGSMKAGAKGAMEAGAATSGEGLVVAYKLHMIDPKTYSRRDTGSIPFELEKVIDVSTLGLSAAAQLRVIEAGANRPLPRDLLWACDQAEAKSRDMVAAWIVELKPKDPKRKSLQIAFPAFPKVEDCQNFSGVIYSRIDPLTDKIIRQKANISIIQEELSDSLKPIKWEARISIVDESFNIRPVREGDLAK